ncbi:MAG: ABC transporter ATP-binding protein [Wujia sp.]
MNSEENMIKIRNLEFEYFDRDDDGNLTDMINAIRGINFDADKGEFIAIAGKNGSGKSTFARILNRLLVPIDGTITIDGLDARDPDNEMEIRKRVGMVFQDPDDQLVGSIVAEDVAFGAENIGCMQEELWSAVLDAINKAWGFDTLSDEAEKTAARRINELSGGEKQKCAIAGVLAMGTGCVVLDEATSMLDSKSRWELLTTLRRLCDEQGLTVILITHIMEELLLADTIYIMYNGKIVRKGRREAIFANGAELSEWGLELPELVRLRNRLLDFGIINDQYLYNFEQLTDRIKKEHPKAFLRDIQMPRIDSKHKKLDVVNAILVDGVSCSYGDKLILRDVSLEIAKGEYVAIMGQTGSGKSTLLQTITGLLKCKEGSVYIDGLDVNDRATDLRKLRCKIGYVFQYAHQQLFAKNVYEDVVFGPRNVGISEIEAEKRAYESISLVGLSEDVYDMPINKLSGGQKKRVALAGVLAMQPEYLILDEPLAGLDPAGKEEMLQIIDKLHKEAGITIIMVSHDAEAVARYADRVIVMDKGQVAYCGDPAEVFYEMSLKDEDINGIPCAMRLLVELRRQGLPVKCHTVDSEQAVKNILEVL